MLPKKKKKKLFNAIKDNGYKWNPETKELEKLEKLITPKFKIGDRVRYKYPNNPIYIITSLEADKYYMTDKYTHIKFGDEDDYSLLKFDISTLKPFDKVLVKCSSLEKWRIQFFEKYDKTYQNPFICLGSTKYKQCIPYEGNEHLLGTADDCADFYKTWEE